MSIPLNRSQDCELGHKIRQTKDNQNVAKIFMAAFFVRLSHLPMEYNDKNVLMRKEFAVVCG